MTANTGTHFPRTVIHIGPLALNFHVIFVKHLEKYVTIGWNGEISGTIFLNWYDAIL